MDPKLIAEMQEKVDAAYAETLGEDPRFFPAYAISDDEREITKRYFTAGANAAYKARQEVIRKSLIGT